MYTWISSSQINFNDQTNDLCNMLFLTYIVILKKLNFANFKHGQRNIIVAGHTFLIKTFFDKSYRIKA